MSDKNFKVKNGISIQGTTSDTTITADNNGGILIGGSPISSGLPGISAKIPSGSTGGTYTFNNTFDVGQYIVNQTAPASFTLGGTTVSNTSITPISVTSSVSSLSINASPIAAWTNGTFPTVVGTAEGGLSVANGFLFAMGGSGFARSSDGTTWTTITSGSIMGECSTAFINGVYVTGGYMNSFGQIFSSTDGINWTQRVSQTGNAAGRPPKAVATSSGSTNKFVVTGNSGHTYYSTNGTSWNFVNMADGMNGATSNNTTYIIVGGSNLIYSSTNGQTWTQRSSASSPGSWYDVAWGNGLFVAVGDSGHINTSTDGASWTNRTSTSGTTQAIRDVSYNASASFPWMASLQNGSVILSTDGINWILRTTGTTSPGYGIEYFNSQYRLIAGNNAYRFTSNVDGSLQSDYFVNFIGPSPITTLS
jgi:hypothetical protein